MGINPEIIADAVRKMALHDIVLCMVCDADDIADALVVALDNAGYVLVSKEPSREVIQADSGR